MGDDVFHFSCRRGFEHNSCHQLHRTQAGITSGTSGKVLVHTVWDAEAKDDEFPGLYPPTLPRSATLSLRSDDNKPAKYLTFSSQWRSQVRVVAVDCATGQVSSHTPQGMDSMSLLATDGQSRLVAIRSNPLSPPTLVLGQASLTDGQLTIKWRDIKTWVPTLPADVKGTCCGMSVTNPADQIERSRPPSRVHPSSEGPGVRRDDCVLSNGSQGTTDVERRCQERSGVRDWGGQTGCSPHYLSSRRSQRHQQHDICSCSFRLVSHLPTITGSAD